MRLIGIILMWALLLLVMTVALCGCTGNSRREGQTYKREAVQAKLDTPFALTFGQIASMEDEGIVIEFGDVTEDSRCPVNVTCVWEGQVTVALNISRDGKEPGSFSLTSRTGHEKLAVADIDGYSIRLVKVEPLKTKEKIELAEYIITLRVSKTHLPARNKHSDMCFIDLTLL